MKTILVKWGWTRPNVGSIRVEPNLTLTIKCLNLFRVDWTSNFFDPELLPFLLEGTSCMVIIMQEFDLL